MFAPLAYPPDIEPLVRLVEDTPPERIVPAVCDEIDAGRSSDELLRAAALAVVRSSDVPAIHHGGPLHPVAGQHAIRHMKERLPEPFGLVAVVQNVVMANRHIHFLSGGPFIMPEAAPASVNDSVPETLGAIDQVVQRGEYNQCERFFLYLTERLPPGELFEHLLRIVATKAHLDDHYLLYTVFTWRVLDALGWEQARHLMRPLIRFVTRPPLPPPPGRVDTMIGEYSLLERSIRVGTGADETPAIAALADGIGSCDEDFNAITHQLAFALEKGLSLDGVGEALSLGASQLFLRSRTRDWMEAHLNTAANAVRHVLRQPAISLETKLRLLLSWDAGPDVRMVCRRLAPARRPDPARADRSEEALHREIESAIEACFRTHERGLPENAPMDAEDDVDRVVTLAQQYVDADHPSESLFALLGAAACRDEHTEMHAFKQHQALYEEFHATRPELRTIHLVAAAQSAALMLHRDQNVFEQARARLGR